MFPYDPELEKALATSPQTIAQVLAVMQTLDGLMGEDDGLKWFNWLYMEVTNAVEQRTAQGGFEDTRWLSELDVQFARLYFDALALWLAGETAPGCWTVVFDRRRDTSVARIQFALAGINAHINHDLALAIDTTCRLTYTEPSHGSAQYRDYTSVNPTLDSLVATAKQKLMSRLLGDALPPVSHLEDTFAAWNVVAARETAWVNAEVLWKISAAPTLWSRYVDALDGAASLVGKTLLVPAPLVKAAEA